MRIIAPILATVIFAAALIISYAHTLELMHEAGLHGVLAHLGVITFELAFALGTLSLVFDSGSRSAAYCAIGLGLAVVASANIMSGVTYGVTGVAVGVAIPAAVVVGEVILKGTLSHTSATPNDTTTRVTFERQTVTDPSVTPTTVTATDATGAALPNDTAVTALPQDDTRVSHGGTPAVAGSVTSDTVTATGDTPPDSSDTPSSATATHLPDMAARRRRVAELRDAGATPAAIAAREGVSVRTIHRDVAASTR